MKTTLIQLDSVDKVRKFVNIVSVFDGEFDLGSDRYVVDAKSIMGIFSLDLNKPLRLDIHDDSEYADVLHKLADFIVSME